MLLAWNKFLRVDDRSQYDPTGSVVLQISTCEVLKYHLGTSFFCISLDYLLGIPSCKDSFMSDHHVCAAHVVDSGQLHVVVFLLSAVLFGVSMSSLIDHFARTQ